MDFLTDFMKRAEGDLFNACCIRNRFYIDQWFRQVGKEIEEFCDQQDAIVDGHDCAVFLWSCIAKKHKTTMDGLEILGKHIRWDDGWLVTDEQLVEWDYQKCQDWSEFFEEQMKKTPVYQKIEHVNLRVCIPEEYNPDMIMCLTEDEYQYFKNNTYSGAPYLNLILREPEDGPEVLIQEVVKYTRELRKFDNLRTIHLMILKRDGLK